MNCQSRRSGPTSKRILRSCSLCLINFPRAESQTESTSSTSSTLFAKATWDPFANSRTGRELKLTLKKWKTRWSKSRKTGSKSSRPSPSSQVSHSAHLTFHRAQGPADSSSEEIVKTGVSAVEEEKARPFLYTGRIQKGRSSDVRHEHRDRRRQETTRTECYWQTSIRIFRSRGQKRLNVTLTYLSR